MTVSVASTTIRYSRKSGVYTTEIISPGGDLVQYYKGTAVNPGTIYQDFGKLKPILYLMTMSSRTGEGTGGRVKHDRVDIYVNGLPLEFDPNTKLSTTIFGTKAGQFKLISSINDGKHYDGIQILENLLTYSGTPDNGYAPITIRMVGRVTYQSQTDEVQGTYTIACAKVPGSSYLVTIKAGDDGNNFVITSQTDSDHNFCKLEAVAYDMTSDTQAAIAPKDLTYEWFRSDASDEAVDGWLKLEGATGNILTVTHEDVISYCDFKVNVCKNDTLIGSDIRSVKDSTDSLGINMHPVPLDETIEEGSESYVTYTPAVTSNGVELPGYVFRFLAMSPSGVPLNKYQDNNGNTETDSEKATTKQASFKVTEAMCRQAQGDVSLTVFAEEPDSTT